MNNAHKHMLVARINLLKIVTNFRIIYHGLCFAIDLLYTKIQWLNNFESMLTIISLVGFWLVNLISFFE
jgi:hypothetical protein